MSMSCGTEEKEISSPQMEEGDSPDLTSQTPCCASCPGRNLTTMVVRSMPSSVGGGEGRGRGLAGWLGGVAELCTMEV